MRRLCGRFRPLLGIRFFDKSLQVRMRQEESFRPLLGIRFFDNGDTQQKRNMRTCFRPLLGIRFFDHDIRFTKEGEPVVEFPSPIGD